MDYLNGVEQKLEMALSNAANVLRGLELPGNPVSLFEKWEAQVAQPCVVAVVGQVKAGKSSFINALLHADLAKVGGDETTATINYFCYARRRISPYKPVRCFWRDGHYEDVSLDFLNSLQGHDIETLRRAATVDHLEYYLPDPDLQRVTLVDTPGTQSVLDEHQDAVVEFMRLRKQLSEAHSQQTKEFGDTADAVIYLIKAVAGSTDQQFLEEFTQLTQGHARAFNAIGVIAKIDLYPETIERRAEMATKISEQLKEYLNTVVPVSASMRRALDALEANNNAGLQTLMTAMRSLPSNKLDTCLANPNLYLKLAPEWSVSVEQRKALRGTMEWTVFATIARVAADAHLSVDEVRQKLDDIAGFALLNAVLERHIFQRSRLLRCYRIVRDVRNLLGTLHYLPTLRKRDREEQEQLNRYLAFVLQAHGDAAVARELQSFLRQRLAHNAGPVEKNVQQLETDFAAIFHELEQYNADFEALNTLNAHSDLFKAELDELQSVFGLHGMETEKRLLTGQMNATYVKERQRIWRSVSLYDSQPLRRDVAAQAVNRYGYILRELTQPLH